MILFRFFFMEIAMAALVLQFPVSLLSFDIHQLEFLGSGSGQFRDALLTDEGFDLFLVVR